MGMASYRYLQIPNENTHMRVMLDHISRDIWISRRELFELLAPKFNFTDYVGFCVQHNTLSHRGFLEWRITPLGHAPVYRGSMERGCYRNQRQYRLTEVAHEVFKPMRRRYIKNAKLTLSVPMVA